jgi:predicted secreted acid phosphatase
VRRLALAIVVVALGCAPARAPRPKAAEPPPVPALYEAQGLITLYVESGRYDADFARVVAAATAWLEERAPKVRRPAIVLDIDETALSNWQAYRVNHWARILQGDCNLERGPCNIRVWQAMGRSTALTPTRDLVRRARELGVAVFFVTGRPGDLRESTEHNLREQGFAFDEVFLLPPDRTFTSGVQFKAPIRQSLAAKGYTILLSMGDQQSDLDGGYAERTFKLPNPVYFLP